MQKVVQTYSLTCNYIQEKLNSLPDQSAAIKVLSSYSLDTFTDDNKTLEFYFKATQILDLDKAKLKATADILMENL